MQLTLEVTPKELDVLYEALRDYEYAQEAFYDAEAMALERADTARALITRVKLAHAQDERAALSCPIIDKGD